MTLTPTQLREQAESLKPCPFCSERAEITREETRKCSCIVECTNCGCFLEANEEGELSGRKWNTRPQEEALQQLLREARDELTSAYKVMDVNPQEEEIIARLTTSLPPEQPESEAEGVT
jgi:hypothetical protein